MVKFLLPLHQQAHSTAGPKERVPSIPTTILREFFLKLYFDLISSMELGIQITNHFLMNVKWINTHCENNPPSMEDTDSP